MEKAKKTVEEGVIAIAVTRLGSDPVAVKLKTGGTVKEALALAGVSTSSRSEYFVDGQRAELEDILEDGDVLALVTPKQAGSN